jgi:DNA-directed RNA polymerase specialized sigma24 family protein
MLKLNEYEAQDFYKRWSTTVFTFARLFLGEEEVAEEATQQAFVTFLSEQNPDLDLNRIPLRLLRKALDAARGNSSVSRPSFPDTDEMEDMVKLLPTEERAVFILRSVLDLEFPQVSVVTALPMDRVQQLWSESLLHVRDLWLKKAK